MARIQGAQISEREKLQIVLHYERIKDGRSDESVEHLCAEFANSRNIPAILKRQIHERGSLRRKHRTGRASIVKNTAKQQQLISAVREDRSISSR